VLYSAVFAWTRESEGEGVEQHRPLPSAEAEEGNGEGAGARLGRMDKEKVGVRPASTRLDTSGVCGGGP
jgi:hypothetical protein